MKINVTKQVTKALTTGFAVAALSVGATALAAPANADVAAPANGNGGSFECYTKHIGLKGKVNCSDPSTLKGNFAAKYQCAGSSAWFTSAFRVADGKHPITVECSPHSAVTGLKVIPDPVPL
ncbi:hypothetical protein [Arthrobacter rhombi]|uniref:hypothetical protein n=1 Tax=Arthrobacter rhombi TaxID=71253 RepID=UPI003FD23A58